MSAWTGIGTRPLTIVTKTLLALAGMAISWMACTAVTEAQAPRPLQRLAVNGGELEYEVTGSGEPVLLIHGTGVAATFAPTMSEPSLSGYRLIRFHRRGFAGSSRSPVPFTMTQQAADARALLKHSVSSGRTSSGILLAAASRCSLRSMPLNSCSHSSSWSRRSSTPTVPLRLPGSRTPTAPATSSPPWPSSEMSMGRNGGRWLRGAGRTSPGGEGRRYRLSIGGASDDELAIRCGRGRQDYRADHLPDGWRAAGNSRVQLQMWIKGLEQSVLPGVTHAMLMENPKVVAEAIAACGEAPPVQV